VEYSVSKHATLPNQTPQTSANISTIVSVATTILPPPTTKSTVPSPNATVTYKIQPVHTSRTVKRSRTNNHPNLLDLSKPFHTLLGSQPLLIALRIKVPIFTELPLVLHVRLTDSLIRFPNTFRWDILVYLTKLHLS
jgi:hypothetical protein